MRNPAKLLPASLALAMLSMSAAPALAQDEGAQAGAGDTAQPGDSPEDVRRGAVILRAFNQVLNSEDTPQEVRAQLLSCLYNNSLRNVSVAAGKVVAEQEQLADDNPQHVFIAASAVCGVQPAQEGEADESR
ncbi:hypothetical protein D6851_01615 [Altericroceibacterium spongiae]|uniref:Uncharacterized protein n=1 Tax=Altericroceibacterium spongiae TaxID=2320269 RepID=A0A420ER96_9SPHN|nr:hypothetical protein [Altericroceibacterium spongiae]RKF23207.1 hypothetical protein D6851_01615 [Altericroceibacterium spongiae]